VKILVRISIIGSGYVGTAIGKGFKQLGNEVIFYDVDEEKVKKLKEEGLNATSNIDYVIKNSEISFITVPTPSSTDGKIDLSYIKSASKFLAESLKFKKDYHLVVIKSTVVPLTTEKVVKPILEEISGKKCGKDFGLAANPEFLTEIHSSWSKDPSDARTFFTEERIVIGEFDKRSGDVLEELYKPLNIPIIRTNLRTAELIKYASNCILASRIIPWYDFKPVCEKLGIDVQFVANVVAMDSRIGKYGSIITGKGYQGKCLPKDVKAFINFAKELGCNPVLLETIDKINDEIQRGLKND
jgi:UDPglucose 6-dehydrogenase